MKYATAISPQRRNATGRVKSPSRNNSPPTHSIHAPINIKPCSPPSCGAAAGGKLKSFCVPCSMNSSPMTMRRILRTTGDQRDKDELIISGRYFRMGWLVTSANSKRVFRLWCSGWNRRGIRKRRGFQEFDKISLKLLQRRFVNVEHVPALIRSQAHVIANRRIEIHLVDRVLRRKIWRGQIIMAGANPNL